MAVTLIDFDKDDAAQELLGYAGIQEPYEDVIVRASLDILRQSVPDCKIESIRFVCPPSHHPRMRVRGMPIVENSTKIRLQDMTMPFDLEFTVISGDSRHRLDTTFTFECRNIDEEPTNEYLLDIRGQHDA